MPAIVIALLIHVFLAQATRVYGQSMEPNLHTNERLVIEKFSYRFHGPRRGDVVVLRDPGGSPELLIKRVVGLPGERVTLADGRVYIDGAPLDEPYLNQVDPGRRAVMGGAAAARVRHGRQPVGQPRLAHLRDGAPGGTGRQGVVPLLADRRGRARFRNIALYIRCSLP